MAPTSAFFFLLFTTYASAFSVSKHPLPFRCRPLSLAAECRDGSLEVSRTFEPEGDTDAFDLAYKVFRPMTLSSRQACPILVLHGGPSVPSDYLLPLVNVVPYRSIVYYDQLGCGQSDEPADLRA